MLTAAGALAVAGALVVAGALAAAVLEAEDPEPEPDVPALDGAATGEAAAAGVEVALTDTLAVVVDEEVEEEVAVLARL